MITLEDYEKLEKAWEYQDFVTKTLQPLGIVVNLYQSRYFQMSYGESASGIEIKNDRNMANTKRIYFEFNQTSLRGTENKDSGIMMEDDSWLYVIGDYKNIYIFAKNQLKALLENVNSNPQKWEKHFGISIKCHKNNDGKVTSYGMVVPIKYVEEHNLAIRKIVVGEEIEW